ncbi:hypothetical protein [Georgenia satyanarayanai]|uniref:hypothetical protein n=1 Tax=Georgenia satyanarayanai TaxID=860221 RepID=UPI001263FF41|nr:hypothetical protein [Georgenia satyanarayanai]
MFTIRNVRGVALFLFATTFLWITPAFASKGVSTDGLLWAATRILALLTMAGLVVATVGLFRRDAWWETVAVASAVLGVVAVLAFWFAASRAGETIPWFTALILGAGCLGVLVLLRVPALEQWVDHQVMSG